MGCAGQDQMKSINIMMAQTTSFGTGMATTKVNKTGVEENNSQGHMEQTQTHFTSRIL